MKTIKSGVDQTDTSSRESSRIRNEKDGEELPEFTKNWPHRAEQKKKNLTLPSELEESSRVVHWVSQAWRRLEIRGEHKWMYYSQPLPLTSLGRARRG